jgi:hypothetical protein
MELKQIAEYALQQNGVREAAAEWDALDAAQRRAAAGGDVLTKQVEIQEKAVTRIGARLNTLANSELSEVEKAFQRLERAEALEAAAKKSGLALTDAQILGIQRVRQRYEELSKAANDNNTMMRAHAEHVGFASHQWLTLNRQFQDAGTMLAMGSSPMQVLTSQGAQIYDVFASSRGGAAAGLREFGSAVAGAITPTRVLGAAVVGAAGVSVAALVRWKSASDELQQSLDSLGRFSGVSLAGARSLAESAAAQSGLSVRSSSRIVAGGLAAGLDAASAGGVAADAKNFSTKLGMGLDDVAQELTSAFADPARGADELARRYGLVTMAQSHHVAELVKVGDRSGAAAELLRDLHDALGRIADRRSPFSRLIDRLETGASDAFTRYGEALANNPANATVNRLFGIRGNDSASTVFARMRAGEEQRRFNERQADLAGQDILGLARSTAPDLFSRRDLEQQIEKFNRALGKDGVGKVLDELGVTGDMARQTLDRMRVGLELLQSPLQRVTEANALALRSAEAETIGQRAQIAAEQAYRAELQSSRDKLAAAAAAEGARNVALLESARAMREQAKTAERRADLAGLGPYERAIKEAQLTLQDDLKKADRSPGAGVDLSIYDKTISAPFDRVGTAATRLADTLTSATDRIGRLIPLSEWRGSGSVSASSPAFAGAGNAYDPRGVAGYIQERAAAYGLNPAAVLRIAQSEGLSQFYGDKGTSFGALQLHVGGGLGDTFRRQTGLDPSDPRNERMTIDWGLRYMARTRDVSPWHGAARVGVTNADVFGGAGAGDQAAKIDEATDAYRKYGATIRAVKTEQVDVWLRDENRALDDQRRAIDLASGAWGVNASALVAVEEKQRLFAEAQRRTIPITEELAGKIEKLSQKAADNAKVMEVNQSRTAALDFTRSSVKSLGSSAALAWAHGENVGEALRSAGQRIADQMVERSVGNLVDMFLNKPGSPNGGILDGLLGNAETQQMNVQAATVNVAGAGGIGGLGGDGNGGGGLLGGLFSGIGSLFKQDNFAGQAPGAIGPFQQSDGGGIGGFFSSIADFFKFADGGIMTSSGALPLHRYATGGIADRPQLALFGEGRDPEAFVPLPDGRRIPVHMTAPPPVPPQIVSISQPAAAPKFTFNNYAPGVEAIPRTMSDGEIIVEIRKTAATMIAVNNKRQAEASKRAI